MKTLKLSIICAFFALIAFTGCENDESLVDKPDTEESAAITEALDELSSRFSSDGTLNSNENVTNNIIFDFCFNFVYPLDLAYNTGSTVTVNSLEDLIDVILNSTEELYISGIAFPFDVEVFNDDDDSIEIETIEDEAEFITLIESCEFDDDDPEVCTEEYDPVCVEITDPDGNTFLITYPNECYAELDGFTENDFVDDCNDNSGGEDNDCFEFNYPLSIINQDGEVIEITSEEDLELEIYDEYYWDFVYPISVTLLEDGSVVEVNNIEEFALLFINCFDDGDNELECSPEDLSDSLVECESWFVNIGGTFVEYSFLSDGTVTVTQDNNVLASGTWEIDLDDQGLTSVIISTNSGNFTDVWTFLSCTDDIIIVTSSNPAYNVLPGCDDDDDDDDDDDND